MDEKVSSVIPMYTITIMMEGGGKEEELDIRAAISGWPTIEHQHQHGKRRRRRKEELKGGATTGLSHKLIKDIQQVIEESICASLICCCIVAKMTKWLFIWSYPISVAQPSLPWPLMKYQSAVGDTFWLFKSPVINCFWCKFKFEIEHVRSTCRNLESALGLLFSLSDSGLGYCDGFASIREQEQ